MAYSVGGSFYNELDFLTNIGMINNDNKDTIYNSLYGYKNTNGKTDITNTAQTSFVVYKGTNNVGTGNIKKYYNDKVNSGNEDDLNIYLKLIRDFNKPGYESMRLKAADIAYLKDLGVYPINRMWCLRRYPEMVNPPNNLMDWDKTRPIATVCGWIEPGDDKNFFNISFNESWTKITERLDQVLMKIMDKEFGLKGSLISVPGWSQGLLFSFLKNMGLTNFDMNNIPQGNPNVLQEAATRVAEGSDAGFGLASTFSQTLKVTYEQKFIGDIDPGSAMLDIIQNLLTMGTSEVKYVMGGADQYNILGSIKKASRNNSVDNWWSVIKNVVYAFMGAIGVLFKGLEGSLSDVAVSPKKADPTKSSPSPRAAASSVTDTFQNVLNKLAETTGDLAQTILASTVAKWRWPLMGSISVMDGSNSTPWHLTMGNPYSPTISLGNIVVKTITVKSNNEFGFNDIPTQLTAEIQLELGRNLGAQEIFQMFNNSYNRIYKKDKNGNITPIVASTTVQSYEKYINDGGEANTW